MLKEIEISNFQSHKKTKLKLHSGVNVIVGKSDMGKSSILRALYWVLFNKPNGDGFRSHWSEGKKKDITSVRVKLDDDTEITRSRGTSLNRYEMDDQVYEAFGANVPKAIEDVLRVSDINCRRQMDAPFLLSSSPGEVAQYLNRIANLDSIGTSLSNIARDLRNGRSYLKAQTELIEELEKDLEKFDWVEEADEHLQELEELETSISETAQKAGSLQRAVSNVKKIKADIKKIPPLWEATDETERLEKLAEENQELKIRISSLREVISRISHIESEIEGMEVFLEMEDSANDLIKLTETINQKREREYALMSITKSIKNLRWNIKDTKQEVKIQEAEFHQLMPDFCPLCGGEQ